ncbi:MAG: hypothetical protein HYZ48_00425, partial [Chlamydiales bacterium]|nr:hypothetical protein [Chlamydiales bacterium]
KAGEKLKKEIYQLNSESNITQVAEKFLNLPSGHCVQEVVDFTFANANSCCISVALKALAEAYPSFTLSPCDQIKQAISSDTKHRIDNNIFTQMLEEKGLLDNTQGKEACYHLAARLRHMRIYPPSATLVPTNHYNLNFLWINLNPQDRIQNIAQHIFGEGLDSIENAECIQDPLALRALEEKEASMEPGEAVHWEKVQKSFIYRISKWADLHPQARMYLWYDSALVTQKAQQNTATVLKNLSQSRGVDLKLRDIRQLPNIDGEIEHSLHPGTPVYFRVDLIKALIADHMMSSLQEEVKYCVVSDIDIMPMPPELLFDERTFENLTVAGYVFNGQGSVDLENNFFIFNTEMEDLQKIHHETILQKTADHITSLRSYSYNANFKDDQVIGSQYIWNRYSLFQEKTERKNGIVPPRKSVNCPTSQFKWGGSFAKSDHQSESFHFVGSSNVPYTRNGRSRCDWGAEPIDALKDWKPEPLN